MSSPLTIDVVEQALEAIGVRGVSSAEGARVATFGPWVGAPAFRLIVMVPDDASILLVRAQPGVAFEVHEMPELLAACNAWQRQHRWPRLTVSDRGETLMVEADIQVPCPAGLSAEQAAGVIATFVAATHDFWEHMTSGTAPIDGVLAGLAELLDEGEGAG
jgi:hypothetical protein